MTSTHAWRVKSPPTPEDQPQRLVPATIDLEAHLETWIEEDPDLLLPGLTIIGRQVSSVAGPVDLLAMDGDGYLVVIELKRAATYRHTVAQVLDYGASVARLTQLEVQSIADEYLSARRKLGREVEDGWEQLLRARLGIDASEWVPGRVRLVVAGAGTDSGVERIVDFLSGRYSVPLNAYSFDVFVGDDKGLIVVRRAVLSEEEEKQRSHNRGGTDKALFGVAKKAGTEEWCKRLLEAWGECDRSNRPEKSWWSVKRPYPHGRTVIARVYPTCGESIGHLCVQAMLASWASDSERTEKVLLALLKDADCGPDEDGWIDLDSLEKVEALAALIGVLSSPPIEPEKPDKAIG